MVTPITTPPVLVDSAAVQYFTTFNCFVGPVSFSGALYAALADRSTAQLEAVKSTDGGATWARVDDGGGTTPITAGTLPVFDTDTIIWLMVALDSGGASSANFVDAQDFDLTSEVFGPLVAEATAAAIVSGGTFGVLRSDGSILMLFPMDSPAETWAIVYASGSFGTAFLEDSEAAEGIIPIGAVIDSGDVTHVLNYDTTTTDVRYSTITLGNAVTGTEPVPSVSSASGVLDHPVADSGNLAFPYIDGSGAHTRAKMLYATGATSNPATASWTDYDVWTSGLEATSEDSGTFAIMDGADLLVFWINTTALGITRVYSAVFNGGGFDAPVLYYDSSLYPPTGSTQDPTMRGLSIVNLSGTFVGIAGMNIDGTGNQTFYLSSGGAVQSGYRNRLY